MPAVNLNKVRWSLSLLGLGLAPMCASFATKKSRIISSLRPTSGHGIAKNPKYRCTICNLSFGEAFTLKRHSLIHVEGGTNKFVCHYCGKGFTQQSRLDDHIRAHTASKPACQWCLKPFASPKSLKDHQKGCKQRPADLPLVPVTTYECATCDRTYKQKKDLNKHQKKKGQN